MRTRRRAACVLLVVAPLAAYGPAVRACPHHSTLRISSQRTLRMARRRKRGSRDDLARPPDIDNYPQIPRHIVPQDTKRHLAGELPAGTNHPVASDGDRFYRRRVTARNIRTIRVARGLSQQRLADLVGVDRRSIMRWEAGQVEPRDHITAILYALDCTLADLYADHHTLESLP